MHPPQTTNTRIRTLRTFEAKLTKAMRYIVALLAVVVPSAAFVLAVVAARRPRECPLCGRRELRCVNFIKATVVSNSRRAPDSWSYHACRACGAEFKFHRGQWSAVEDRERRHFTGTA